MFNQIKRFPASGSETPRLVVLVELGRCTIAIHRDTKVRDFDADARFRKDALAPFRFPGTAAHSA